MPKIARSCQILLFQQMEMLLSSGVLISDALSCLRDRFPDKATRKILGEVHVRVSRSRAGLSQALARYPRSFPPGVIAILEAGEQGGSALLAERFADLAERLAYEDAHRRQIRRACAYPAFVVCLAAGLCLLLLGVVFPRLSDLLASLGSGLPPLARGVVATAALARHRWWLGALLAAAFPVCIGALRRVPAARRRLDRWFLALPVVGAVYRDATVALICKVYRSLYLANQPAPATIDLCAKLVENQAFRDGLRIARDEITRRGATLSAALSRTGLFPPLACLAIEVGEQSGKIAPALDRVCEHYSLRARRRLDAAVAVIDPLLTLAVVGGTGIILLSFFQAAYQVVYATR
jgi:general secretion pathway protein F